MPSIIDQLFSVPIYHHTPKYEEIFLIQSEIKSTLPKILSTDLFENPEGWDDGVKTNIKQRFNTIDFYNLSNLKNYVDQHVRSYIKNIQASDHKSTFLSHSWVNITEKGDFQDFHQHQDSVISGVYYYQTNGNDGDIVFKTPNPFIAQELFPLGNQVHKYVAYKPAVGKIIIFPGWLDHKVEKNYSENARISIAFNYLYDNSNIGQRGYK
jgi:uncharacterized protein (TIGR02466 family)